MLRLDTINLTTLAFFCWKQTWLKDVGFWEVVKVGGIVNTLDFNGDGCWTLPVEGTQTNHRFYSYWCSSKRGI